jgi:hypothetical protein
MVLSHVALALDLLNTQKSGMNTIHPRFFIAVAVALRAKGVWGLRPQPGVEPLHPVLTLLAMAICNRDSELGCDEIACRNCASWYTVQGC